MADKINTFEEYSSKYKESVDNPEEFWGACASDFVWREKWNKVLDWNFEEPSVKWFIEGKLNITENCLEWKVYIIPNK